MPFFFVECNKRFHDEREPRLHTYVRVQGVVVLVFLFISGRRCVRAAACGLVLRAWDSGSGISREGAFQEASASGVAAFFRRCLVGCIGQAHTGDMNTMLLVPSSTSTHDDVLS
jgi:hypothetical protein